MAALMFLVGLVVGAGVVLAALALVRRDAPLPEPFPEASAVVPEPVPEPVETLDLPSPPNPRDRVVLALHSPSGQCVGRVSIPRRSRKPTFSYRPRGASGTCHFVAERADGDGFIYRQVGQDRA